MTGVQVKKPSFLSQDDLNIFEASAARFFDDEATPAAVKRGRDQGMVDLDLWRKAGAAGLLLASNPEAYGGGGGGGDIRHEAILMSLMAYQGVEGFGLPLQSAITGASAPYCHAPFSDRPSGSAVGRQTCVAPREQPM